MSKKTIAIIGLVLFIGVGVLGFLVIRSTTKKAAPTETTEKKRVREPLNVLSVDQRPYLQIQPTANGRNVVLVVKTLPVTAQNAEYELEYQSGTLLQGAFGQIGLASLPAEEKVLLGSCSAGGACTYHEDVKGGSLLTRYDGTEPYALKSDWRYFDNATKETAFASKDAKFQIESSNLASTRYLVVFNTAGYPAGLEGTPLSDPYSLTSSAPLDGSGKLVMRANEEGGLKVAGWNGEEWLYLDGTVDGKTITVDEAELLELYIVVK